MNEQKQLSSASFNPFHSAYHVMRNGVGEVVDLLHKQISLNAFKYLEFLLSQEAEVTPAENR